MSEATKIKSFDYAIEVSKQLITLASLLIGITLTFFDKFKWSSSIWLLHWSWYLFFVSIVAGIFLMMKLTGEMSQNSTAENLDVFNVFSVIFSFVQILTFGTALVLLIFYAKDFDGRKESMSPKIEKYEIITKSYEYHHNCCDGCN